jgi:MoaA/NifB/PqqE/SkfB family radical SAM enzyme
MSISKDNKVFCTFPWIHIHITPRGKIYPCCNTGYSDHISEYKNEKLIDVMNSEPMKELRYNMMNNIPSKICNYCYDQEKIGSHSGRTHSLNLFGKDTDSFLADTKEDGTLTDFKMKYFDIRFSNVCNMKCRTCSPDFSSQWSKEIHKLNKSWPIVFHADNNNGKLLSEVISQIENTKVFYFAGGEPLLTDEHYIILDELLKRKITDVTLLYNTNISNMKYKGKEIIKIWSKFKTVKISASIDHYGERAEYIRNGTNWGVVESNLKTLANQSHVHYSVNTVLSIFNYPTLKDFYLYLIDKGLYSAPGNGWSLHKAFNPAWYMAQILPRSVKDSVRKDNEDLIKFKEKNKFCDRSRSMIREAIDFVEIEDKWGENKDLFLSKVQEEDKSRNEDFRKTFPELRAMYE